MTNSTARHELHARQRAAAAADKRRRNWRRWLGLSSALAVVAIVAGMLLTSQTTSATTSSPAPDFTLRTTADTTITLSALRGRPVLLGAGGVALGWTWADPAIGLLITVAILMVLRTAGRDVFARLMDAVDPELTDRAEDVVVGTPGVAAVTEFKLRWIGHHLHAEGTLELQPGTDAASGAAVAAEAGRRLRSAVPGFATLTLTTATCEPPGTARPGEGSAGPRNRPDDSGH